MKPYHLLISLGFIALAALAIGVYQASSAPLPAGFPTPTPNGRIEVKNYPAYRAATYRYRGQLSEAANRSFYPLYQHISSNDISMTAPVETRYPDSTRTGATSGEAEVSFLYRDTDTYPKEVADNIRIESLGLQGGYDFDSYQQGLTRLNEWLAEHPSYRAIGSPRRFFYDGPYVPDPLKRSEIEIPVEAVSSNR